MNVMGKIASFIAILGLVAAIADWINKVPKVLQWMDLWGATVSWLIKIAIVALGCLLWFISRPRANDLDPGQE